MLRRIVGADGRSRAFVNDQPAAVGALRELGALLLEIHGQHETVGLLDSRTHLALLDGFGGSARRARRCGEAWRDWREARESRRSPGGRPCPRAAETSETRRAPRRTRPPGAHAGRGGGAGRRARLLGAADKALADLALARDQLGDETVIGRIAQAGRAVGRAARPSSGAAVMAATAMSPPRRSPASAPPARRSTARSPRRARPPPPSTPPPKPSTSSPTGWTEPRSGCSPCAPWPASWASSRTRCPTSAPARRTPPGHRDRRRGADAGANGRRRGARPYLAAPRRYRRRGARPATAWPKRSTPSWRRSSSTRRASGSRSSRWRRSAPARMALDRVAFEIATLPGAPFAALEPDRLGRRTGAVRPGAEGGSRRARGRARRA